MERECKNLEFGGEVNKGLVEGIFLFGNGFVPPLFPRI
jgi:hypothetical protein